VAGGIFAAWLMLGAWRPESGWEAGRHGRLEARRYVGKTPRSLT
jgi:hypothetical protein